MAPITRDQAETMLRGGVDGVAEWNRRRAEGDDIPSLEGIVLQRAKLRGVNLQLADLRGAKLQRAKLLDAEMAGATLLDAEMAGATLLDANIQEAFIYGAKLRGAILDEAGMTHVANEICVSKTVVAGAEEELVREKLFRNKGGCRETNSAIDRTRKHIEELEAVLEENKSTNEMRGHWYNRLKALRDGLETAGRAAYLDADAQKARRNLLAVSATAVVLIVGEAESANILGISFKDLPLQNFAFLLGLAIVGLGVMFFIKGWHSHKVWWHDGVKKWSKEIADMLQVRLPYIPERYFEEKPKGRHYLGPLFSDILLPLSFAICVAALCFCY